MRWLLIFAPAVLAAQSIVQLPAGSLSCGAVKRSVDEIQVYCAALRNAKWRYLDNDLFVVEGTGATYKKQTWNDSPDVIEWTFTPIAGVDEIDYTVTVNGIPGKPGKLTGIFGQPPPATGAKIVGTLVKGKCQPEGTGFHKVGGSVLANEVQANCILPSH